MSFLDTVRDAVARARTPKRDRAIAEYEQVVSDLRGEVVHLRSQLSVIESNYQHATDELRQCRRGDYAPYYDRASECFMCGSCDRPLEGDEPRYCSDCGARVDWSTRREDDAGWRYDALREARAGL
ncbi:MAG: hypothetical protein IJ087_14490 [Eggerthellaceae bacterium]|nr:hypothetical protein [Eggerthellaceae bacterium]